MFSNTNKNYLIYLRTTIGLLLLGVLLGLICAGVQYAGAFLMFLCFALAPGIVCGFNLRGKFSGTVAMDAGLIVGVVAHIASWRSQHGFDSIVDWNLVAFMTVAAMLISGTIGGILFLCKRNWPPRKTEKPPVSIEEPIKGLKPGGFKGAGTQNGTGTE